ncbi:hypothetical protein HBI56_193540 [Parastagonospora nodorum]|nr:hypothetical protein HBH56_205180 [Parastagonospora nodorum]KAH3923825.1 hypothetical protein HBH54_204050 [Parastagonospora nodorum]KAH3962302.1 hypothetical protein HBH51_175350 [Parastagonospora nodorum]KAH3993054.1 hypothetical protein HBI10_206930 [Parastagonospora nodorum]KAH4019197.1 hypothetical protein HBI09_186230 [Parastagonospora nodorum]
MLILRSRSTPSPKYSDLPPAPASSTHPSLAVHRCGFISAALPVQEAVAAKSRRPASQQQLARLADQVASNAHALRTDSVEKHWTRRSAVSIVLFASVRLSNWSIRRPLSPASRNTLVSAPSTVCGKL